MLWLRAYLFLVTGWEGGVWGVVSRCNVRGGDVRIRGLRKGTGAARASVVRSRCRGSGSRGRARMSRVVDRSRGGLRMRAPKAGHLWSGV